MSENPPKAVHAADQLGARLRLTALVLGVYRRELMAQGFTQEQVTALVLDMQRWIMELVQEPHKM